MRDLWRGDALRTPFLMLVLMLAPVGLVLVAGALAGTITSDLDTPLLGWGALALGGALVLYLPVRYAVRRSARAHPVAVTPAAPAPATAPDPAPAPAPEREPAAQPEAAPQTTWTTGAGDGESAGPSQWAASPSE